MIYNEIIKGECIILRTVTKDDAEFILEIRTDPVLGKFLTTQDVNLEKQQEWLVQNSLKKDDYYFIIEDLENNPIGTIALHNIDFEKNESEWGRWICKGHVGQVLESQILIHDFAFNILKLNRIFSRTNKENVRVCKFHDNMGATFVKELIDPVHNVLALEKEILAKNYPVIRNKQMEILLQFKQYLNL
jgi:RimJ/RimL family protein N-acetyltransferase